MATVAEWCVIADRKYFHRLHDRLKGNNSLREQTGYGNTTLVPGVGDGVFVERTKGRAKKISPKNLAKVRIRYGLVHYTIDNEAIEVERTSLDSFIRVDLEVERTGEYSTDRSQIIISLSAKNSAIAESLYRTIDVLVAEIPGDRLIVRPKRYAAEQS